MSIDAEAPRPRGRPRKIDMPSEGEGPPVTNGATAPEAEGRQSDDWGMLGPTPVTDETRKPLGRLKPKLAVGNVPAGYHARWINDTDKGRVREALEAGYAFMKGDDGKPVQRVVGVKKGGGPLTAYHMIIPLHWYLKDQVEKAGNRAERRSDMMRGNTERGGPGVDGRYVPMRGNAPISSIVHEDMGKKG
jgi:hypothetical protein